MFPSEQFFNDVSYSLTLSKKKNRDTKRDTRIHKFFRQKTNYNVKITIVKRPCCLLLTPLPARLLVTSNDTMQS